ncbi:unnamed protein product [Auanema sp. JU1783]|nr:unnamed protein product [Auanema sp. JU1783]
MSNNKNNDDIDIEEVFKVFPKDASSVLPRITSINKPRPILKRTEIIINTVSNSEHPHAHRFDCSEINNLKLKQKKENELLDSFLQKSEKLGKQNPPIDVVKIMKKKKVKVVEKVEAPKVVSLVEEVVEEEKVAPPPVVKTLQPVYEPPVMIVQPPPQEPILQEPNLPPLIHLVTKSGLLDFSLLTNEHNLNLVFAQIIYDAKSLDNYRIRPHERKELSHILDYHGIPPSALNNPEYVPAVVKYEIIETVRTYPWYFSRIFEVIEIRENETVSLLLSIAEHGIRFLIHLPFKKTDPLQVHDHISWEEIKSAEVKDDDYLVIGLSNKAQITLKSGNCYEIYDMIIEMKQ